MALSLKNCENLPDDFCYACKNYSVIKNHMREYNGLCKIILSCVFWLKLKDQDKSLVPHKICVQCLNDLSPVAETPQHSCGQRKRFADSFFLIIKTI